MAQIGRTVKIDENNHVRIAGKMAGAEVGVQRRAALGELGNRVKNPNANGDLLAGGKKGTALGDLKQNVGARTLKEVKPRVDTYWRKDPNLITNKPMTRTESIKLGSGLAAQQQQQQQAKLVRTRTLQTAKPELAQRVQRVQRQPTAAENVENNVAATTATDKPVSLAQHVRRQESNLTRRSLTKLRAAIRMDNKKKPSATGSSCSSGAELSSASSAEDLSAEAVALPAQRGHSAISLADVENIDANDSGSLILVSEYVNDIYAYMYRLERASPIADNYLHDQREVTHKMRGVLVDWLNEVHMQFTLVQETFFMAVAIIDRYLQAVKTTTRQNLQLVGVTALFMASKYEELYPPEIKDFVYITDDTYDKRQILEMERNIFKQLQFNMGRPLPIHFLRRFAKAAHSGVFSDSVYLMAKYFIELAAVDYSMVQFLPSEVAGAALLLALRLMNLTNGAEPVWNATIQYYTKYTEAHLRPIVHRLALVVKATPTQKLRSVYNKYKQAKLGQISAHPQLTAATLLDAIIAEGSGEQIAAAAATTTTTKAA